MILNTLLNQIITPFIKKYNSKSIEYILKKSVDLLDPDALAEIKQKTRSYITKEGAFSDRAGRSDIYYSLFGMFVWEVFALKTENNNLSSYIKGLDLNQNLSDVHKYCLSILSSKLRIKSHNNFNIKISLINRKNKPDYHLFMGILALYYQKKYFTLFKLLKVFEFEVNFSDLPCPVLAAQMVIAKLKRKNTANLEKEIMCFYRNNGSFAALKNSPVGDLLSTAVALYALNFIGSDLRIMKPYCLEYIDSLYDNGNFRASPLDFETDIEYTFYGLLALGSLV
jgi:hypothetical protein